MRTMLGHLIKPIQQIIFRHNLWKRKWALKYIGSVVQLAERNTVNVDIACSSHAGAFSFDTYSNFMLSIVDNAILFKRIFRGFDPRSTKCVEFVIGDELQRPATPP